MPNVRVCEKCQREKPIDAFPMILGVGRGLWCSQCVFEYNEGKEPARDVDPVPLTREERRKDYHVAYYRAHREVILERAKEYGRKRRSIENDGLPRPVGRPKKGDEKVKRKSNAERSRERVINDIGGTKCDRCGVFQPNDKVASFNAGDGKKETWCFDCFNKEPSFRTVTDS